MKKVLISTFLITAIGFLTALGLLKAIKIIYAGKPQTHTTNESANQKINTLPSPNKGDSARPDSGNPSKSIDSTVEKIPDTKKPNPTKKPANKHNNSSAGGKVVRNQEPSTVINEVSTGKTGNNTESSEKGNASQAEVNENKPEIKPETIIQVEKANKLPKQELQFTKTGGKIRFNSKSFSDKNQLPIRKSADPESPEVGDFFSEIKGKTSLKYLSKSTEKVKIDNMEDYWYKIPLKDGGVGFVFGYYLIDFKSL
ncbi:SH3 domain-containing protein [Flavobacterium pallidum]|uniref:Uncharacterized protein n=1 Tax=Flavobacterium pallidum TaxID=2172098 RepID=A0A2S1SHL0_9FLAO|nr:SH3 domain-containing protein [Flavobacterium pallidum]AWI25898.1 hypothetical protein HYN49_08285 [Flavobacterium pallidum]